MSEENTAIPAEHVSLSDTGAIVLSEEAMAAMDNVAEPPEIVAKTTEPATPAVTEPTVRTIKWNGQEVQVAPEQEVELIQKGYNYEAKMAQLESERAKLQSYNGLVSAIEASPEIRQKVSAALGYQQAQPAPRQQFDDPIEQLKYEVRQETLKEVEEKFMKPLQAQTAQQNHIQTLNAVKQQVQSDPMYNEVQAEILNQVKSMPASVAQNLYRQLDQDPRAYTEMFNNVKARLSTKPQPVADPPTPAKRETKAPILEGTLNAPDTAAQQKQTAYIKELERKSRAGDFRATGELMSIMA